MIIKNKHLIACIFFLFCSWMLLGTSLVPCFLVYFGQERLALSTTSFLRFTKDQKEFRFICLAKNGMSDSGSVQMCDEAYALGMSINKSSSSVVYILGLMDYHGKTSAGFRKNVGLVLIRKAAEDGYVPAMETLFDMYEIQPNTRSFLDIKFPNYWHDIYRYGCILEENGVLGVNSADKKRKMDKLFWSVVPSDGNR